MHHIRDAVEVVRKSKKSDGAEIEARDTIEDVADKRLLLLEEEFSRVLRISRKDGTTLSATLREAWDRDVLMTTAKTAPEKATGAHVTVIGHITPEELRRELASTEISNGFANRFLFVLSRKSRYLSCPPEIDPDAKAALTAQLSCVKAHWSLSTTPEISLSEPSRHLWHTMKREIEEEAERADEAGLTLGKVITRGAPYVLRIAAIYAALECAHTIEPIHLAAAREVWRYSVNSARTVFGDELSSPDAQRTLEALAASEDKTLTREQVHELFHRHRSAAVLTRLRDKLIAAGRIEAVLETTPDGKKTEWWRGR